MASLARSCRPTKSALNGRKLTGHWLCQHQQAASSLKRPFGLETAQTLRHRFFQTYYR